MEEDQVGCVDVLQAGWKEDVYGLFFCVVGIAFEVGQQLLLLTDQLLRLAARLGSFATTTIRTIGRCYFPCLFGRRFYPPYLFRFATCVSTRSTSMHHVLEILLATTVKTAPNLSLQQFCARSYKRAKSWMTTTP